MRRVRLYGADGGRRRPNWLLWCWQHRYEIAALLLVLGVVRLGQVTHWAASLAVVLTAVAAVVLWPAARAFLVARYRCVVIQHRLRTVFYETGLTTLAGRLPAILWCSPKTAGVRVLVSCPAGVEVGDFVRERKAIAAACFAADVLVERHPRYANIVALFLVTAVPPPP